MLFMLFDKRVLQPIKDKKQPWARYHSEPMALMHFTVVLKKCFLKKILTI